MRAIGRGAAPALALLAGVLLGTPAQAAQIDSSWSWKDYGPELVDVSCASPLRCVAVGQDGATLRSPGTEGRPLAWTFVALRPQPPVPSPPPTPDPQSLVAVSCSASSCVAISNTSVPRENAVSFAYRSTDGGATWSAGARLPAVDTGSAVTANAADVDCDPAPARAAARTCYAVGDAGGVWRSTDDGVSWKGLKAPAKGAHSYASVACPSATCVTVGGENAQDASSAILQGDTVRAVDAPSPAKRGLPAVACDTTTHCTAVSDASWSSIALPEGEWGALKPMRPNSPSTRLDASSLACPSAELCVTVSQIVGYALRSFAISTDQRWQRRPLGSLNLDALDCVGTVCVAIGPHASWFVSPNHGGDWAPVNEVPLLSVAQCSAALRPTCVAGGEKDLTVSRSGGELWVGQLRGIGALNVASIDCVASSTCLVLTKNQALYTTDLDSFAARRPTTVDPAGTDVQTCVTDSLCVGFADGRAYTTFDGAVTDWSQNGFPGRATAAWCRPGKTDPVTCYVATRDFIVRADMTRDEGRAHWSFATTEADPDETLEAIGCDPTGSTCTAAGVAGYLMHTTTDPMHWDDMTIPDGPTAAKPVFRAVSCPSAGVCLVGGKNGITGYIASTVDHWANWSLEAFEGLMGADFGINGFGCESPTRCLAVGSTVLAGARTG